jgi:hypothetical protein
VCKIQENAMINKNKIVIALLVLIVFSSDAFTASSGTTLFDFLKLPRNATQGGLAGMATFGKNKSFENPAILGFLDKYTIAATHTYYFQDVEYTSVNGAISIKDIGLSASYFGLDYGKMDHTREAPNGDYILDGKFGTKDSSIQLSAGYKISQDLSLGAGFKYIWRTMHTSKMRALAMDVSALFCFDQNQVIGGGFENLGPNYESYPLPGSVHVSYANNSNNSFAFGFEFKSFFDSTMWLKGAGEFNIDKMFFIRCGYAQALNHSNSSLGEWYKKNLSLGFGFEIKNFSLDYAWIPFGDLGNSSVISLRFCFK